MFPLLGAACESQSLRVCKQNFRELVSHRMEAIQGAFGDLHGILPEEIEIKFILSDDPDHARFGGLEAYDLERRRMIFPRRMVSAKMPNPLRLAVEYWPYYEDYGTEFPVIEAIDNVLWSAYLQEAAKARGGSWPHKGCGSVDIGERLSCEMLIKGISEHVKQIRNPMFNTNRLDRILPENFSDFRRRVWRRDQRYLDVQRYGGILLVEPLITEFGVPRALAYIAQTPFRIENDNLRTSALRYQERARQALVW